MTGSFEVRGAEAMQSSLRTAAKKLEDMTAVNREVAGIVGAAVRAPRRTGRLAASVAPRGTATEASIVVDQPNPPVIEYGSAKRHIRPARFVANAFTATETQTTAAYEKSLQGVLDDVKGA